MERLTMLKSNLYAPSFRLSPVSRKKVDKARLYTDIIGLGFIYIFGSFIPPSFQWIPSIYTIMAWVTILTIDPTRLPDSATTKINQLKAWQFLGISIPLYAVVFGILLFIIPTATTIHSISLAGGMALIVNACLIELYFRNVLQAKLRQLGLSVIASICIQGIGFSVHFYFSSHSLLISVGAFILSAINGGIVYKTRSIYPNFLMTSLWVFLFGY
jgi:hypothetical protein